MGGPIVITEPDAYIEGVTFAREMQGMDNSTDPINAALWALSGYDPALIHLAELRQRTKAAGQDSTLWISMERLVGVYLESQCETLAAAAGVSGHEIGQYLTESLGDADMTQVTYYAVGVTRDPLMLEVIGYAMYLGTFTAHGEAPWNKFAEVMADLFYDRHPLAKKTH